MTAPPRILVTLGAPDDMAATTPAERRQTLKLRGNAGLVSALVDLLRAEEHPHDVVIVWPEGETGGQELLERTGAQVLVNVICEPVHQNGALQRLAGLERDMGLPTLNPSHAIVATARPSVAQSIGHHDGVRAPHCTSYRAGNGALVEHIHAQGHRYPVLLRPEGRHGSVGLVRAADDTDVQASAGALAACTVTDFVDFRSDDGLWRKYRMVYAGGRLFRRHLLIDQQWNLVGDARFFMYEHGHLAEEQEWLEQPIASDAGSVEARILRQFEALQLDFGVIDYALAPDGDVVVFEINACVQLTGTIPEQYREHIGYIEANNDDIIGALLDQVRSCAV